MRVRDLLGERYRLEEFVDGGAMGEVWKATDTRLNRTVAVKVLHASLSGSSAFRRRFEAEARSAAALRAPGIVNVYDFGEDSSDDGGSVSFLVMEFVEGRPLSAVIAEKGRLSPGDVMAIVGKVAVALEAAHCGGVIHRDVKPGNILLTAEGSIKVVDFGIARAQGEAGLTSTGQVMGTVAYVSPEQLYNEDLTGASDIYSLGVVAYECLTGHKPFAADAPAAVIRAQLHETPPPLPASVPRDVSDLVMRCLEKEPGERWSNGTELAAACRALASQLPQGDSTEPMDATDLPEGDDSTVRMAAPGRASISTTRNLPGVSREAELALEAGPNRKRRKLMVVAAVIAAALLLLGVTAGVLLSMSNPDNHRPNDKAEQSEHQKSSDPNDNSTGQGDTQGTGDWSSSGSSSSESSGSSSDDTTPPDSHSSSKPHTTSPSPGGSTTGGGGGDNGLLDQQ
ncbi:MAG TPA: serine/threonine-protein kinase [Stackebrandtia sp.]|uniref:serine/threonine-protein kinase n=1 Tax=Stackebrandtia sp. TaxID=2023065 RepID=UPI002D5493AA|nr:serine/threonine-protein kinase [Stackebrandtia sp.]HZE38705.1 serine/threonine-protein kinase [Stackebrandtia sp.]